MSETSSPPPARTDPTAQPPPWRARFLALFVWSLARLIGMTLRVTYVGIERLRDLDHDGRGGILVSWHGRSLVPANLFRGRGYWALISLSRDGDIQNRIFQHFGFQTIRGSTGRGGVRAVLQLARKIADGGVLAFTPDGPRGPTHKVQQGTIFLAQRSGCPVYPLGVSARPRKLLPTWDSYMIPAPGARVAFVVGPPLSVDADLDEAGREQAAVDLERAINACEKQAEEMLGFAFPDSYPT